MKQIIIPLFVFLSLHVFGQVQTTWQVMTPSVVGDSNIINTMSAPTKNIVWADIILWPTLDNFAPTQTIIKTVNGGASWTTSIFSDDPTDSPNSIFAFDEQTAFISSVNGDYVSSVYRTRNGGTTWERVNVEHPSGYINSVYFWDRMNGIVIGDPLLDADENGNYFVYTTRDGGDTWVRSANAPAAVGGFNEYGYVNAYGVLGTNTIFFTSNNPFYRIFKSEDRGLNWREIPNPLNNDTLHKGSNFNNITFFDSHNGLVSQNYNSNAGATGGEAPTLRTTDGGETWVALTGTNVATRTEKGEMNIVPGADSVYVIGHYNQGSSYTTDFGKTYTVNTFGGNGVKMFSPTEGWMPQFTLGGTHGRIGKFTGNLSPSTMRTVTFQVDMTGQNVAPNGVYVTGDYWSWKPNALKMSYLGNNIFEVKTQIPRGITVKYKFMNGGNWGQNENVPSACGNSDNRSLTVGQWDMHVPKVAYSSCMDTKGADKPVTESRWCSRGTFACDYFESYGMNTKIGQQSTRWKSVNAYKPNGTEGGNDDPEVVSFWNGYTNYSGGRALHIKEGKDVMWLLGNQTTGSWDITMRMYVPTNYEAHLIAISNENNPDTRVLDYVLHTNKTVWSGATYKTYPQNEWLAVKLNINLNNHSWSVVVNGTTVYSGSNADLKQLGALELFSPSSYSEYFVDELEVKRVDISSSNSALNAEMAVYPNPAQEDFTIHYKLHEMTDLTMSLTDMNGRTIWSKAVDSVRQGSETVNVKHLPVGVYFVKFLPLGEDVQIQKLIIAK